MNPISSAAIRAAGAAYAARSPEQLLVLPGIDSAAIAALPMPCLWVYGEWSRSLPSYRALLPLRPAGEFRVVPQGGHFFPISNAALVMSWLKPLLGVVEAQA